VRRDAGLLLSVLLLSSASAVAQDAGVSAPDSLLLRAGQLVDVKAGKVLADQGILVSGQRIVAVGPWDSLRSRPAARVLDLSSRVVLPGLIDAHTHLLANIPDTQGGYTLVLATRGPAYRALEGAAHARATLLAGVTTVRDVESEGSGFADVALRNAIAEGLVDGPRMLVATRGIAAVGGYLPIGINPELTAVLAGAQMISGVEDARRAAREQIRGGADLLKVYADWPDRKIRASRPTLTVDELRAVVEEAHKGGRKVAAHAVSAAGIVNAVNAGVDSIEHGSEADEAALKLMASRNVPLVPTLLPIVGWAEKATGPEREIASGELERIRKMLATARRLHVRLVFGSDPASRADHGRNAEELVTMGRFGVPPAEVLRAATIDAAALLDLSSEVGTLETGKQADLIAVEGNPLVDLAALRTVSLVMRAGKVYREPGSPAGR
jgi:imidazolonepropionase-like amidohydrolase